MGITTFHREHGFKTQPPDHLTDAVEIISLELEVANRFGFMGIHTKRHHQCISLPGQKFLHGLGKASPPGAKITPARKRNIQVRPLSIVASGFIGIAHEERELMGRVGMDRNRQNITALIEYILRAIAMMIVDIKDRDLFRALGDHVLGGDGGIVQEAIATVSVGMGMMSRRTRQRKGGLIVAPGRLGGRDHCLGAPIGGLPGSLRDRRVR